MNKLPFLLMTSVVFVELFSWTVASGDKNKVLESSERKFRSGKVNQVWEKAVRVNLDSLRMTDLYADLKHHDQLMMENKRTRKTEGMDDGLKEAELTEQLHGIMVKYGLAGKGKSVVEQLDKESSNYRFSEDPKLEKLWQTANKHGKFTQNELDALKLEFTHHRRKVEEYEILQSETLKVDEMSDNSVGKQMIMEENNMKKQKMTELHGDIQEGYERLHLKTKQGTLSVDSVPFTEPRVAKMWEEAKKGNFSDQELQSIKEELHHFQTRVEKHLFFRDELKNVAEKVKFHGGKETSPRHHLDTHDHLQNKVQNLAAKVKKLHHDLAKKLSSGTELHREL